VLISCHFRDYKASLTYVCSALASLPEPLPISVDVNVSVRWQYSLVAMPVKTNDAYERFLELIVNVRVTERIDWTVEVAEPVGDVIQCC